MEGKIPPGYKSRASESEYEKQSSPPTPISLSRGSDEYKPHKLIHPSLHPSSPNTLLIPCTDEKQLKKVVVKVNRNDHPTADDLERQNLDYDITKLLLESRTLRDEI